MVCFLVASSCIHLLMKQWQCIFADCQELIHKRAWVIQKTLFELQIIKYRHGPQPVSQNSKVSKSSLDLWLHPPSLQQFLLLSKNSSSSWIHMNWLGSISCRGWILVIIIDVVGHKTQQCRRKWQTLLIVTAWICFHVEMIDCSNVGKDNQFFWHITCDQNKKLDHVVVVGCDEDWQGRLIYSKWLAGM